MKRQAKFSYKKRKGLELCNIAKTEPKKCWSSVKPKSRSKCLIDSNTMLQHFENVLGSNSPELCDEVINLLNDHDFDDINIDILDFEISEDEIIKAIKKLKYGKSAGNDNIIGEMVTNIQETF